MTDHVNGDMLRACWAMHLGVPDVPRNLRLPCSACYMASVHKRLVQKKRSVQIIAFLETGAGKTHISVMLIEHVAPQLRKCAAVAAPPESDGGCARARVLAPMAQRKSKLAFFMAPTVALVKQVHCGQCM